MTLTHDIDTLERMAMERYVHEGHVHWPWHQIGVFPTDPECFNEDGTIAHGHWFNYTVGLSDDTELWIEAVSIEGRNGGNELMALLLNFIATGWVEGTVQFGDTIRLPLGCPDGIDRDGYFWIANERRSAREYECGMSNAEWCVPIIWSSPSGWEHDDG